MASGDRPIAIDFGASALKTLQLSVADDGAAIIAAAAVDTPENLRTDATARFAHQLTLLPRLVKGGGFRGKKVVCALPASQTFTQHLQVQKVGGMTLADAVRAELNAQTGCDPKRVVVRPVEVRNVKGEDGERTEVICFAVARDLVMQLVGAFKKCRLELVGVHCQHIALLRSFDHITKRASDANLTSLYIDIGADDTKVAIARGRDIVFARTVRFGGALLDAAIAERLQCPLGEARARRLANACYKALSDESCAQRPASTGSSVATETAGSADGMAMLAAGMRAAVDAGASPLRAPDAKYDAAIAEEDRRANSPAPGAQVVHDTPPAPSTPPTPQAPPARLPADAPVNLTPEVESLIDEIAMGLRHHSRLFPNAVIERAIFVGGESHSRELCQHIARTLRLPAQIADPLAPLMDRTETQGRGVNLGAAQPGWAIPFGLSFCPEDF